MAMPQPCSVCAEHFKVSTRTILFWHEKGYITGYRGPRGAVYYDIDEIEHQLRRRPRSEMRDGRRRGLGRIVAMPVVVAEDEA